MKVVRWIYISEQGRKVAESVCFLLIDFQCSFGSRISINLYLQWLLHSFKITFFNKCCNRVKIVIVCLGSQLHWDSLFFQMKSIWWAKKIRESWETKKSKIFRGNRRKRTHENQNHSHCECVIAIFIYTLYCLLFFLHRFNVGKFTLEKLMLIPFCCSLAHSFFDSPKDKSNAFDAFVHFELHKIRCCCKCVRQCPN